MNIDEKSTDLRSPLKAFQHQRGFSDVTFHFPRTIDPKATAGIRLGGDSCPDIVQLNYQEMDTNLDGTSSCINDNDLDYDAFFSQYIDVDNDQEERCAININLCGGQISQGKENADSGNDEDKVLQLDRTRLCPNETPKSPPLSKHHGPDSSVAASIQNLEAKKAMSAAKLAELWIVDPKRAKR